MLTQKIFSIAQAADEALLWFLIVLSVVSIGIIIERFLSIRKVLAESMRIQSRIRMALQSNSLQDVEDVAKDVETIEGRAVSYALKHMKESGSKGLEELFNTYILTERPRLEKYLSFLATIGSNAPYVGLLGTVLGIMKAFNDLALSAEAGQQTVMAGISTALVATAVGLFVAIPAVAAFNYFQRQIRAISQNIESVKEMCIAYAKKQG